ncbi:MAG: protein phosphatase [Candidatus Accumulibacter phosphatis]|uniref:Protein phosphatase n=1 Tax=Candidatus Accumulibacter phosphatis TaxID=327160 RepID=A0A6A7RZG7_9PROT|nr:protein phosphatase [Candidatus Accumulibacter phosphatis]
MAQWQLLRKGAALVGTSYPDARVAASRAGRGTAYCSRTRQRFPGVAAMAVKAAVSGWISEVPSAYAVCAGMATDVGRVRRNNEDALSFVCPDDLALRRRMGVLAVVADGMGGHRGGEVASTLAVETICRGYFSALPCEDRLQALERAMLDANHVICRAGLADPSLEGMGTTATVLVVVDNRVFFAHVGDSRLYHCANGRCRQLTEDHTLVQQMVKNHVLSAEDARNYPMRNVLMRSLGTYSGLQIATQNCAAPQIGDAFVLCSDGLHASIEPAEIAEFVASLEPQEASQRLVDLACVRDGSDNISVAVVVIRPAAASEE